MVPIQANTKFQAEQMAISFADGYPVELWDGGQFLRRLQPLDQTDVEYFSDRSLGDL